MSCKPNFNSSSDNYDIRHFDQLPWQQQATHFLAWSWSGLFAWIAIGLTLRLMFQHLTNYNKPIVQRHIVRILCMVPVYSITAWLTFRWFQYALFFELFRGLFEAMVIHEFFHLIMRYVGDTDKAVSRALSQHQQRKLPPPLCFFKVHPASEHFIADLRIGVLQYAFVRPLVTLAALILELNGRYCPDSMSFHHGKFWCVLIVASSTALAMYTLVLFYLIVRDQIAEHKPITKFVSVKFVLFMSFWQSIFIGLFVHFGIFHDTNHWTVDNLATGVQSFFVCIEMFIAAMLHKKDNCFGFKPFGLEGSHTPLWPAMADAFDPRPTMRDVTSTVSHAVARLRGRQNTHFGGEELKSIIHDQNDEEEVVVKTDKH